MNLLNDTIHRPFPLPSKKWIMRQTWRNLFFLHWPIQPEVIRPYIRSPLKIDTFDHHAWIGIVAFVVEGINPRGLPSISLTRRFLEVNVRTYVLFDGKPGVYFMSLDVENWASCTIAKRWYRLPYYPAKISFQNRGSTIHCESIRKGKTNTQLSFSGSIRSPQELNFAKTGTLDHWLTERYCLYSTDNSGNIYCGDIHHRPWPLQKIDTEIEMNTLFSPFNIDVSNVNMISHFSKGVDSLMWNIKKVYSNREN